MKGLRNLSLLVLVATLACRSQREVVVFHAASLSRSFGAIAEAFERSHPDARVRLEPSGSQVAARKVAELGMRADVVAVADREILERILIPGHADFAATFAGNELVLAHGAHSRYADEVTTESWPAVLPRAGVRLGCSDVDLAPIGYRTVLVWELAAAHRDLPDLAQRLRAQCTGPLVPDETELAALLAARAVDYAFLYRSTAAEQHLRATRLAPEENLGDAAQRESYAMAAVDVRMGGPKRTSVRGAPIVYALTVPTSAPNRPAALRLAAFILSNEGQKLLERSAYTPAAPPLTELPEELRRLLAASAKP